MSTGPTAPYHRYAMSPGTMPSLSLNTPRDGDSAASLGNPEPDCSFWLEVKRSWK